MLAQVLVMYFLLFLEDSPGYVLFTAIPAASMDTDPATYFLVPRTNQSSCDPWFAQLRSKEGQISSCNPWFAHP